MGELIGSILVNLISSAMYDIGIWSGEKLISFDRHKDKKLQDDMKAAIASEVEQFQEKHEECAFLDTDDFHQYLKGQNPIKKITGFLIDGSGRPETDEAFVAKLTQATEDYFEQYQSGATEGGHCVGDINLLMTEFV